LELETYVFAARVATRVLLVMSAICVIGTAIWIYRICREARIERAMQASAAPGREKCRSRRVPARLAGGIHP
jgi:hypothetical protein